MIAQRPVDIAAAHLWCHYNRRKAGRARLTWRLAVGSAGGYPPVPLISQMGITWREVTACSVRGRPRGPQVSAHAAQVYAPYPYPYGKEIRGKLLRWWLSRQECLSRSKVV